MWNIIRRSLIIWNTYCVCVGIRKLRVRSELMSYTDREKWARGRLAGTPRPGEARPATQLAVLSHQMGVFQWVWFKKSEHHSIMWEDFNRHRKKSNKILFEWWYFLSIFICIFYIGLSLFCEKILKCHFFLFFPAIFSPVSFNLLNGIQKKYYFYIHWNISIYKFKCVSIKYKI